MWVKVDDGFPEHEKVLEAGRHLGKNGAGRVMAIWIVGMCYCNRALTDGRVTEQMVKNWTLYDKKPLDVAEVMVMAGLFDRVPGGFKYHDYELYQPLAKDVKEKRDWDARRKQLYAIPGLIESIRARDKDLCRYCGVAVNWSDRRSGRGGTYDHVIPRGDNSLENVVVACYGCNIKKGGRTPEQAGMPLLPAPPRRPDPNGFVTSSNSALDYGTPRSRPDLSMGTHKEKDHHASRGAFPQPVENRKVLKALIWRETHAAYLDHPDSFTYVDVLERTKRVAAAAQLAYGGDWFCQQVETAMARVAQQRRRSAA